jgi:hypothetical protein
MAMWVSGCGGEPRPNPFTATARPPVVAVQVRNNNYLDVVVYALRDGGRMRLGTVTGNCNAILKVSTDIATMQGFRLQADPVGSRESYVTEVIYAQPGAAIVLDVASVLSMSSWHLR